MYWHAKCSSSSWTYSLNFQLCSTTNFIQIQIDRYKSPTVWGWGLGKRVRFNPKIWFKAMKLFITSQLKKITLQMWDWKFGKGIQMEKVSPLLCQTSEVLWTEGKTEKKKESVWMRVCWRQDSAPCLPGSQPLFQKKKITDTLLWTWEIQELGGTTHMTHLFWNSPWQQTCLIVTPA